MDSQAGLLANIKCSEGDYYFKDINFKNSFIARMDNKEINKELLKYNDDDFTLDFDGTEDLKYL